MFSVFFFCITRIQEHLLLKKKRMTYIIHIISLKMYTETSGDLSAGSVTQANKVKLR